MTATCPAGCGAEQTQSLLCHTCTTRLERDLGDVASIVGELDLTMSKQAKIGAGSGTAGLARERMPIGLGAMEAADNLANVLTTWARDISGGQWRPSQILPFVQTIGSSRYLLLNIDAIRRHPAVNEMVDEISDAIGQARRVVDRPADRIYLGQCMYEEGEVVCLSELYATPGASEVRCRVCGVTHPVDERRAWLLQRASDMLFTVAEAATMLGEVGGIKVTQASIRGYIHRPTNALAYRPGTKLIQMGDLLGIVLKESERKSA